MNPCKVKICGTTSVEDALMITKAGADYSGIAVEIPHSERSISIERAAAIVRETPIPSVVLFLDMPQEFIESAVETIQPFAVQLLGHESPSLVAVLKQLLRCQVWKTLFLPIKGHSQIDVNEIKTAMDNFVSACVDVLLLDTMDISEEKPRFGGTGKVSDWHLAQQLVWNVDVPVFLAGGINPDNVAEAIQTVRPDGIDLCSGVERAKGLRDRDKVCRLMQNARNYLNHIWVAEMQ